MRTLIIEDEQRMAALLRKGLEEDGHAVRCAFDGQAGLQLARTGAFDVVILDLMLPKMDGYQVAQALRSEHIQTPLLMLTAKDAVTDIVHGLDVGADDYITKPFSFNELLARMHAIERRNVLNRKKTIQVADLVLEPMDRNVYRNNVRISLTRTEYSLLECLMNHLGQVVARHELIDSVWGTETDIESNNLDAFVRLLRQKVDVDGPAKLIHTVRGIGYVIKEGRQI